MRAPWVLAVVSTFAAIPAFADDPPPIPSSLEEAAAQQGPIAPGRIEPALPSSLPPPGSLPTQGPATTPATTTATTVPLSAAAAGEPTSVDGWEILEVKGPRHTADHRETTDACGYERDVLARKTTPVLVVTPAVLVVGCVKGATGLPAPATPALRLPAPPAVAATDAPTPPASPRGTTSGTITLAGGIVTVSTRDGLTFSDVEAVVRPVIGSLEHCHVEAGGPAGVLETTLDLKGGAPLAVTTGTVSPQTALVARCVVDVLRALTFPGRMTATGNVIAPSRASATVTFTFGATGPGKDGARPVVRKVCGKGEQPTLVDGEPSCTVVAPRHPCAPGEKPTTAAGEEACFDLPVERGVPFLKGELTSMGDVQLVNARNSVGVGLGVNVIDNVYFAVIRPDVNLKFGEFSLGLGAPLRFEVANLQSIDLLGGDPVGAATKNLGRFRLEDWDQVEDFVRPVRYLTWGKKEDKLYADLNRVHASTIGHGQLVRRYNPNLDIDEDNLFAQVDGYGDYGGVELMAGPFPIPRLVGGLAFIKPLGIVNALSPIGTDDGFLRELASSWSIGVSYVTDLNTPTGLETRQNPVDQRLQLVVDPANQLVWRNKPNPVGDVVQGVGVDTEVKVLKTGPFDLKVYGDYSHLFMPGDSSSANAFAPFNGGGFTVGGLLRLSLGETPVRDLDDEDAATQKGRKPREMKAAHGLRFRLEARTFAPTYLPSYWNTMYEADRFQFGFDEDRVSLPTKIGYLAGQLNEPWRVGYATELSYAWVDVVGVTAAFEDAYALGGTNAVRGKNLALHVESKGFGVIQVFGTYHFRNFEAAEFGEVFSFESDNEILFVGGRLQILPILFVNAGAQRAFRVGFSADDVRSPDVRDLRFSSVGLQNTWAYGADVELGWQF